MQGSRVVRINLKRLAAELSVEVPPGAEVMEAMERARLRDVTS
jgi:hypothetical protein